MTEVEKQRLRRLATDLEPIVLALERTSVATDTKLARASSAAQAALELAIGEMWRVVRERK